MGFWRRRDEQRALTFSPWPVLPADVRTTPAASLGNPDVWSCVRVLADGAAACPLITYRRQGDGRTRAAGATAELLRTPSEGTTQAGLVATLMAHLTLHGNAYLGKYRDGSGRV